MIRLNKDTHVNGNSSQLVDSNNHLVGTAKVSHVNDIKNIPALGAEHDYSGIESLKMNVMNPETNEPGVLTLKVIGSYWYNATDMDFFLERGLTVHISKAIMILVPTVKNAYGVTPVEHRRKMILCAGICIAWVILGCFTVAMAADMVYDNRIK
jgi:hypothetical protein